MGDACPTFCAANKPTCIDGLAGTCNAQGTAIVKPVACKDDGNACVSHSCDEAKGCVVAQTTSACDDGDKCTGTAGTADVCKDGKCTAGAVVSCDDGNACTLDTCNKATGCTSVNLKDGTVCGGGKTCKAGACVAAKAECGSISIVPPGHVTAPDSPKLTLSGDFTIETWAKLKGPMKDSGALLMGHDEGAGTTKKWALSYYFGFGTKSLGLVVMNGAYFTFKASYEFPVGKWVHVAVSRKGNDWRLFVDGKMLGTTTAAQPMPDPAAPMRIGFAEGSTNNHWPGELRRARLSSAARYVGAFTPAASYGSDASTIAVWPLNDGKGTQAADLGPNGLHGTLLGPVSWVGDACSGG